VRPITSCPNAVIALDVLTGNRVEAFIHPPANVKQSQFAEDPIIANLARAPGTGEPIGRLKVTTAHRCFAVQPSRTEDIYKLYAESFRSEAHLNTVVKEEREIFRNAVTREGQR
jgi:phosphoglucomutase